MRTLIFTLTSAVLLGLLGCASVPEESVELSVTLGRDLAEVHRAHRELAIQYFRGIKQDINQFIDEEYRPFMIKKTMEDFKLLDRIKTATAPDASPDPLQILELFVNKLSKQIESYRKELFQNISNQENELLTSLDDAYQKLQNANSIVTGHLASVRKVHEAQAELLDRANLEGLRDRFIEKTARLSDEVAKLVKKARKGEETIDKIAKELERFTAVGASPEKSQPDE
jgi:hypothetical protein